MKKLKIIFILLLLISFLNPSYLWAQEDEKPAPSQNQVPTDESELENIQKIKDIVASKVAELNLVEKRGIIGKVTDITNTKLVVVDVKGNSRNIDIDELTKFEFSDDDDAGISDLNKEDTYSFVGIYNLDTQRLLARSVDTVDTIPVYLEGAITKIDDDVYQITVVNQNGEEKLVDIQNSTKTSLATLDGDLSKSGFSKLAENARVIAVGFWDKKDKNLLSATRVIHFEDIPPSKEMQSFVKAE